MPARRLPDFEGSERQWAVGAQRRTQERQYDTQAGRAHGSHVGSDLVWMIGTFALQRVACYPNPALRSDASSLGGLAKVRYRYRSRERWLPRTRSRRARGPVETQG